MKKCAGLSSVLAMALAVFACSSENTDAASHDAGAMDGASGGTGGTNVSASCTAYEQTTDLHASCELVIPDCPQTVDEYLESIAVDGQLPRFEASESDALQETGHNQLLIGKRFSFTKEDGMIAGFNVWEEFPFGPCASSGKSSYRRGRLLTGDESANSCTLAPDALETGVFCAEE